MQSDKGITSRCLYFPRIAAAVLALLLIGCRMNTDQPATYFDGVARQAAQAIDKDDVERLKAVAQGLAIDARGRKNMTLLWYAIKGKHYDAVRELVALGSKVDANVAVPLGTPLHHALTHDTRLLQAMLDGGLSPDQQNEDGTSLLQRAMISNAAMEQVELLTERGADVNSQDSIGGTAFYQALSVNRPDIARYLLEHGARFDTSLTNGVTPAWSLYLSLRDLQVGSSSGTVSDFSMENGVPITRDRTPPPVDGKDEATNRLRADFEGLRDMMIARGVKWPPDDPPTVRDQRKVKGLEVAE